MGYGNGEDPVSSLKDAADTNGNPVETASGGISLCAYSRCRKPLPRQRTGRSREYCPEFATSWEVEGRSVTCRELGRAERLLTAAQGQPPATGATELDDLKADLAALRAAEEKLRPLLEAATAALARTDDHLGSVESQLQQRVAAADAERDTAQKEAAEARGRAAAAEEAQAAAEEAQRVAERDRDAAQAGEQRARRESNAAELARARAEGERDRAVEQASELDQRLQAVIESRDAAQLALADTQARLKAADTALKQLRDELEQARAEADQERGAHQRALETLRSQHSDELNQLRSAHAAELEDTRNRAEAARRAESDKHAAQLADLHTRLGAEQARCAAAQNQWEQMAEQVQHWQRALSAVLGKPGKDHQELLAIVQRLVSTDLRTAPSEALGTHGMLSSED